MTRTPAPMDSMSDFATAYCVAALWSSTDDDGQPLDSSYDLDDMAPETRALFAADARAFYLAHESDIHCEGGPVGPDGSSQAAMAGHDFWLTRCGHGAGFWDGDWPEPAATRLDDASKEFGNLDLYIGDDGLIYAA